MTPLEQAKQLRELSLAEFSRREAALKSLLQAGPKTPEDYKLLVACIGFALAELQAWKAGKVLPPHNDN
ncbi:MAG: hypothetical protein Q8J78_06715 [Moraxellaceae bacterium]|nr:hypothetical protein [Moraxellaceae bacterium]